MGNFEFDELKDVFGEPQQYKKIKIYPFPLRECKTMQHFMNFMNINKNTFPNEEALGSSYLKFLLEVISYEKSLEIENMVIEFISCITKYKKESIFFEKTYRKNKPRIIKNLKIKLFINYTMFFTESEFDDIRNIFLKQSNVNDADFEIYDAKLQKILDEALENINKKNDTGELHELIMRYHVFTGIPIDQIKGYTYKQFSVAVDSACMILDYKHLKPLEVSGQIKVKDKSTIKHWLAHSPPKSKYDSVMVEKDKFKNKMEAKSPS